MDTLVKIGLIILGCIVAAGALLYSTKEKIGSVSHSLPVISEIQLNGTAEVSLIPSNENKIVVSGPSQLVENVVVTIKDSICTISQKTLQPSFFSTKTKTPLQYALYVPNLEKIESRGSATFKDALLKGKNVVLKLSGFHKGTIALEVDSFSLQSAGSTLLSIEGSARNQLITSSGTLEYNSEKLKNDFVSLKTTGMATIKVGKVKKIEGNISRTTKVEYIGKPTLALQKAGTTKKDK